MLFNIFWHFANDAETDGLDIGVPPDALGILRIRAQPVVVAGMAAGRAADVAGGIGIGTAADDEFLTVLRALRLQGAVGNPIVWPRRLPTTTVPDKRYGRPRYVCARSTSPFKRALRTAEELTRSPLCSTIESICVDSSGNAAVIVS